MAAQRRRIGLLRLYAKNRRLNPNLLPSSQFSFHSAPISITSQPESAPSKNRLQKRLCHDFLYVCAEEKTKKTNRCAAQPFADPHSSDVNSRDGRRSSQNLLQPLFLRRAQRHRELNIVLDDEIAALARLLGDWHAQPRVGIRATRLRGARLVNVELLAVYRCDSSLPACQGLLQVEIDGVDYVVAVADEERVWFL
jgi:hypothetical protein